MSKVKGAQHTTWSHHETMILNLRDWVTREISVLRSDLTKEVPRIADDPNVLRTLKAAEDMNVQLFDLIRSVTDLAEKQAVKVKLTPVKSKEKDEEEIDA